MCGATSDALSATVQIRWNDGSGGFAETCKPYGLYGWNGHNIAAADLNGDGAVDIAQAVGVYPSRDDAVALTLGEHHRGKGVGSGRVADTTQLTRNESFEL